MLAILQNKQIRYLFLSSFAVLFTGMGVIHNPPEFTRRSSMPVTA